MTRRPTFGVILLASGLGLFGWLAFHSLLTEVGPPPKVPVPSALRLETTNQEPFRQFDVAKWLGWAFLAAALAEIGAAFLRPVQDRPTGQEK